jgi:hypothetical protein
MTVLPYAEQYQVHRWWLTQHAHDCVIVGARAGVQVGRELDWVPLRPPGIPSTRQQREGRAGIGIRVVGRTARSSVQKSAVDSHGMGAAASAGRKARATDPPGMASVKTPRACTAA